MKHFAAPSFWETYQRLPVTIRKLADQCYEILKSNPRHPSLHMDTDDDVGMMWGDGGMLYFWIRKADLQEGRFEDCWMILQCS